MSVQRGYGNAITAFNDGIFPFVSLTGLQLKGYYLLFKDTYLVHLIDIF
jgi:hypothetical protein